MENIFGNTRYNSIGNYLKNTFGQKVIKLSLDGGFTCPNRDGTKGTGGCIFCSAEGSGDFANTIPEQIELLKKKWPDSSKCIAYFQSHTNTYAPVEVLRSKFEEALSHENIIGLAIATRPDCISDEAFDLIDELNKKTFLWVELGLQTAFDETAAKINRCYDLPVFEETMKRLGSLGIKIVVHLIFGLPGESRAQMLESVGYTAGMNPFGIKFHLLNVVRGSQMEKLYPDYVPFSSIEEYVALVTDALEILPQEITVHRLTADAPRPILIAPEWSYKKRTILNGIAAELRARDSFQGCRLR
ncbi:MAG: TIGR01212 family radical SAM protein [Clostridia bacterium]|nr:TIGR01212 family radical SAM protein [Clostridia bacterium]